MWNGMLRHPFLRVWEDISLQHILLQSLQLMLCLSVCLVLYCLLASTSETRDGNKCNNTRQTDKHSINLWITLSMHHKMDLVKILLVGKFSVLGNFQVKTLFQKLWPLMCKRAKLDLRSTKKIYVLFLNFHFSIVF